MAFTRAVILAAISCSYPEIAGVSTSSRRSSRRFPEAFWAEASARVNKHKAATIRPREQGVISVSFQLGTLSIGQSKVNEEGKEIQLGGDLSNMARVTLLTSRPMV